MRCTGYARNACAAFAQRFITEYGERYRFLRIGIEIHRAGGFDTKGLQPLSKAANDGGIACSASAEQHARA